MRVLRTPSSRSRNGLGLVFGGGRFGGLWGGFTDCDPDGSAPVVDAGAEVAGDRACDGAAEGSPPEHDASTTAAATIRRATGRRTG